MQLHSWFDNRTLFCCQSMLAVMFAVVFVWMNRVYPHVRGVWSTMAGFLIGIPCSFLLIQRGFISPFWSVFVANVLAICAYAFVYDGLIRFIQGSRRTWLVAAASAIAIAVIFFYTQIQPEKVPRIVAMALIGALFRGLTAFELIRRAEDSPNRSTMRFFAAFLAILATVGAVRGFVVAIPGALQPPTDADSVQTSTIVIALLFTGVSGLCFLIMATHELVTRSQEALEEDPLSQTLNRRGIEARLALELKRCKRSPQSLCVALVDIDHFKAINDNHGHATGDAAIRDVAAAMSKRLRTVDYLGRYGGDEFLIVLPQTAWGNAQIVAQRLSAAVTGITPAGDKEPLTLSIGITEASPEDDAISLIARADGALYQAKSSGRNCIRMALPSTTFPPVPEPNPSRISTQS
jgi:diguanylate cyclase (GGDEF)-like protein